MKNIIILFFATMRSYTGTNRISVEIADDTKVSDLKLILAERYPNAEPALKSILVSINRDFAFDEDLVPDGAEVAFFPHVSGGSEMPTVTAIVEDVIDITDILGRITLPSTGGACMFTGMVRSDTDRYLPHKTSYLEYEAYVPMAERKMQQIADEIRSKWPSIIGVAIVQRIGRLYPGTPTVLVACTAGHRDTGIFEAARFGIDRLKEIVPIWKKEVGPDGETWIEGDYHPGTGE